MAKISTDINQSKQLAKILPIESADMWLSHIGISVYNKEVVPQLSSDYSHLNSFKIREDDIPCWSLAALLGVLPNDEKKSTTLSRGGWKIETFEYLDKWWCEYEDESHTKDFSVSADNPVDACYELILKLNELKML